MQEPLSKTRRQLLVRMESILGNECYNGSIQNYGPGGVREAEGRSFRYPLTVRMPDRTKAKIRDSAVPSTLSSEALRTGYYAFGANQLDVMAALERILEHLERHHGLSLGAATSKQNVDGADPK